MLPQEAQQLFLLTLIPRCISGVSVFCERSRSLISHFFPHCLASGSHSWSLQRSEACCCSLPPWQRRRGGCCCYGDGCRCRSSSCRRGDSPKPRPLCLCLTPSVCWLQAENRHTENVSTFVMNWVSSFNADIILWWHKAEIIFG